MFFCVVIVTRVRPVLASQAPIATIIIVIGVVFVLLIEDAAIDKNRIRVIDSIHRSMDIKWVRFVEIPIKLSKKALVVVKYICITGAAPCISHGP